MSEKIKLFLDADETLFDSIPAFCQVYSERYSVDVDPTQLQKYNFRDICPLLQDGEVSDIFSSDRFWELLQLKENCFDVLNKKENIEMFDYILVSIGNPKNLYKKSKYIIKNLPVIEQMVLITNRHNKMNKSHVFMGENSVFIDDHQDNLFSSNATHKVCFKEKEYEWNADWCGVSVSNWNEFDEYLKTISIMQS